MRRVAWLQVWTVCLGMFAAGFGTGTIAQAQTSLSFTAQLKSTFPQSRAVETAAVGSRLCSSISSLSRRCHFTFAAECKARGETADHCTRMAGFCHGCTNAYATCKGDMNAQRTKAKSLTTNCGTCNTAYGRCIQRMVAQYGGKLITVR